MVPSILQEVTALEFLPFTRFLLKSFVRKSLLVLLKASFLNFVFVHFCLFDGVYFQYSSAFVNTILSKGSDTFLI